MRKITINPVTRIEGHAKITLQLDEVGEVATARFHVNEFRGFEKFCEGRLFTEMPNITPRICGICPVSHAVASAKAGEMIMKVTPPVAGELVRRLIHLGQHISSHALSFFHLSCPDLLLGWGGDPARRNIVGLAAAHPDVARRGIRLRQFGQEISERITGKKIHAIGIVAGGMLQPLTEEAREALRAWVPEARETVRLGLELLARHCAEHADEVRDFDRFETLYLGTVGPEGEHELYDGRLRFVDARGGMLADQLDPARYLDWIAEQPVEWSYLKYPYYRPLGPERGVYRVGPLARLNVASRMKTPLAQAEFERFRALAEGGPVHGSFRYHQARLIETLGCVEEIELLLDDPRITSDETQAQARRNQAEGVGCSESPRGTLFHHYVTDAGGLLTGVNLLIATGQNNPAMNRSILDVARRHVRGNDISEEALNRVEGAIRCYDPCLSCSTHAVGSMPLVIELRNARGDLTGCWARGTGG
ncbi:MAG: Ni/Fe hydrogenase subunit alpha [Verrucomicrobia bacterium]|nr:Ni/Fe hydrogenase subunit alpha [Verrucomicrobiota bacterium]